MEWTQVLSAIATAIIAGMAVGLAVIAIPLLRQAARTGAAVEKLLNGLEFDAKPLLESSRSLLNEANQVAARIRAEVDGVVDTSQDMRVRIVNAADAAEDRLLALEALLDVMQDEMEDTVLDVAAALRTTRRGSAILGSMKRIFMGSGKKRRRKRAR